MPETSIVIRTFNEALFLADLLEGIRSQTYQDYEIIVVDSGSFDGTVEIAGRFGVELVEIAGRDFTFGFSLNFNVLSLLAEVKEDIPDARAAARVIQVLDELLLAIKLDPEPLLAEAKELEAQVRMMRDQAPPEARTETPRYIG